MSNFSNSRPSKRKALISHSRLVELGIEFADAYEFPAPLYLFAAQFEAYCAADIGKRFNLKIGPKVPFYQNIGLVVYGPKRCPMVKRATP